MCIWSENGVERFSGITACKTTGLGGRGQLDWRAALRWNRLLRQLGESILVSITVTMHVESRGQRTYNRTAWHPLQGLMIAPAS